MAHLWTILLAHPWHLPSSSLILQDLPRTSTLSLSPPETQVSGLLVSNVPVSYAGLGWRTLPLLLPKPQTHVLWMTRHRHAPFPLSNLDACAVFLLVASHPIPCREFTYSFLFRGLPVQGSLCLSISPPFQLLSTEHGETKPQASAACVRSQ